MRVQSASSLGALAGAIGLFGFCAWGCLGSSAALPGLDAGALPPRDCSVEGGAPRLAPNGYYTKGAVVCTTAHLPHLFHGVDRPSLEWAAGGDHISAADFQRIAGWHANVVRIALNQDFWLASAAQHDGNYRSVVDQAVRAAEAAGLDVILDLHWSDKGDLAATKAGQQKMADVNSLQFWTEVATLYKADGRVLFELYNEPHDISPDVWLNGGSAGDFTAVGMQDLYNAIRSAGAENLVIAGGLNWAYSLTALPGGAINGHNVMYAVHPYNKSDNQPGGWEPSWGFVASSNFAPVIATEFGDGTPGCSGAWDSALIQYCDLRQVSWTAWAWFPGGCAFPSLLSDWAGTPTDQGKVIQDALGAYPSEPGTTHPPDAGLAASDGAPAPDSSESDSPYSPSEGGDSEALPIDGPAPGTSAEGASLDDSSSDARSDAPAD